MHSCTRGSLKFLTEDEQDFLLFSSRLIFISLYKVRIYCVFFPGVFLSSRVTGACPVTTDLIMRVNVRTTTTTIFRHRLWSKVATIIKFKYQSAKQFRGLAPSKRAARNIVVQQARQRCNTGGTRSHLARPIEPPVSTTTLLILLLLPLLCHVYCLLLILLWVTRWHLFGRMLPVFSLQPVFSTLLLSLHHCFVVSSIFFFFTHFCSPGSGQVVVTGVVPSPPPVLAFNFYRA